MNKKTKNHSNVNQYEIWIGLRVWKNGLIKCLFQIYIKKFLNQIMCYLGSAKLLKVDL